MCQVVCVTSSGGGVDLYAAFFYVEITMSAEYGRSVPVVTYLEDASGEFCSGQRGRCQEVQTTVMNHMPRDGTGWRKSLSKGYRQKCSVSNPHYCQARCKRPSLLQAPMRHKEGEWVDVMCMGQGCMHAYHGATREFVPSWRVVIFPVLYVCSCRAYTSVFPVS